jgi:O-methyltransferase involved in polyketide biosynthesis
MMLLGAIQLGEVQETLLIPLYFRARETQRNDPIVRDPKAVEIVAALDYDFTKFDSAGTVYLDIIIRTEVMDEQVRAFIDRHPEAAIINLGAGLCGRFGRVDNGRIEWFDLDMPDAIELRRQFYPEGPRNHILAGSMFDTDWMDAVPVRHGQPVLIVAEGLFCYFEGAEVRRLLAVIAKRWPGSEVLFQSISPRYVNQQHRVGAVNQTRAALKWGINSGRELSDWDASYRLLGEWCFIDRHRRRWGWLWYAAWLPWVRKDLKTVMKVSHVRLGESVSANESQGAGLDHSPRVEHVAQDAGVKSQSSDRDLRSEGAGGPADRDADRQ